jgi:general secretion pathway protein J
MMAFPDNRVRAHDAVAGFSLIETLIATALMVAILAALATVTAQWLPNWNRGFVRVQRTELLSLGIADLAAAQYVPAHYATHKPLFEGRELSVTFVRTAIGPNSPPGLEIVRLAEAADAKGLALVRPQMPFAPVDPNVGIDLQQLPDPVVLARAPFRLSFAYAGLDRVWNSKWLDATELPSAVRVTVRSAATGRTLSVSTAALLHVTAAATCARAKGDQNCVNRVEVDSTGKEQWL